ncbi:MAG: hypothetical protein ABIS03_05945 [Gemmatimonadaceae bacterium]
MVTGLHRTRGVTRLGCAVQIAILAILFQFARPAGRDVIDFLRFRDAMKQEAHFATTRTDQEMLLRLRAFTDSVDLPRSARNISVLRQQNRIQIWSKYEKWLKLPFGQSRLIHYRPSAEDQF